METLLPFNQHSNELIFYNKKSSFVQQHNQQLFPIGSGHYPLYVQQNLLMPNELALANTDFSIVLMDLNLQGQVASFQKEAFHTDKINALKFSNDHTNQHLQHVIESASQDGTVKIWDRRSGEAVSTLRHQNSPFYSVDTNKSIICAGTNSELVFWDIRKMKPPLFTYKSSHTDDVTGLAYHPENPDSLISCSTDNLMCQFDFAGKENPQLEDETLEGVYCSSQPLINCGFLNKDMIWAITSINTIEIINLENLDVFTKVEKFPHQADYVIGCEQDRFTSKFAIYAGNNKGELYIYELEDKNKLNLVDMILLPQNPELPHDNIIRNTLRINSDQIVLTTENGDLKIFKYSPEQAQAQNVKSQALELQQLISDNNIEEDEDEDANQMYIGKKKNQNAKKYKPF
ncbi:wd repeat-containing protein 89-like [Stylonychia lemnae]|uniref:Wd repeat-containing protein 89-like n=1 Tax=Stylonychia lemnae TaxID=5949 RepID=A0A078A721_STYLE|nr:wd repeat-containing protein 89-like [Stylonychia lemnae]|eukprot:CDW76576.1 wd repeat-containing protein 89-like [Stylonychia lemnae]